MAAAMGIMVVKALVVVAQVVVAQVVAQVVAHVIAHVTARGAVPTLDPAPPRVWVGCR